jgi:hypothetical protein
VWTGEGVSSLPGFQSWLRSRRRLGWTGDVTMAIGDQVAAYFAAGIFACGVRASGLFAFGPGAVSLALRIGPATSEGESELAR